MVTHDFQYCFSWKLILSTFPIPIQLYHHIPISFISKSIFTQRILSTELWDTNERWASAWARWERSFPRRPSSVCRRWTWRGGWCRAGPPPCPLQQLQHDTSRTSHLCSVDSVMLSIETLEFFVYVQNKIQCFGHAFITNHNEENVRFFLCKLLDFGLRLLESPQNVTFI